MTTVKSTSTVCTTTRSRSSLRAYAAAAALALPLALAGGVAHAATGSAATTEPSVMVFDQAIRDGKVSISYAHLPKNGYVVVYGASADGKPTGEPLGHVELKSGDHRDITVKLDRGPAAGSKLWASLYEDRDGKAGFSRGADISLWQDGRLPLENGFVIK